MSEVTKLEQEFIQAARCGNPDTIQAYIDKGVSVNAQDPVYGQTALHTAAASRARKALRVLLKTNQCDFLLRDSQGRLASELAYIYGRDPAMARLLGIKEARQAHAQGIQLTRRPRPTPNT